MVATVNQTNSGHRENPATCNKVYLVLTVSNKLTNVTYKHRLLMTGLLPLTYWHEYLDLVYVYKLLLMSNDANITIKPASRVTRSNDFPEQITLNIPRANTLTFQNSFYCRAPRIFNCLRHHIYAKVTCL